MDDDLERFIGAGVAPPTSALGVYFLQDFWEDREGYAGFGQFNFRPVERLELSVGARYSEETVETGGVRTFYRSNNTANPPVFKDFEKRFDNVSMMASLAFDVSDSLNTYLTYAEGWKAGGVNRAPASNQQVLPYDDEYSTTYELGLKSTLAGGRVVLNGAVFYIDLQDQQLSGFVPVPGSTPVLVVTNAGASEVRGAELELAVRPSESFEFSTALAYNDTELKDYVRFFGATNFFDMRGLNFEDVPELTASAQTVYRTRPDLIFGGGLEFRLSYRYVDEVTTQDQGVGTTASSQLTIPDFDRLDGRVSYVRDDGWRVTLFVDNVLDSFDYTRVTTPAWTPNIPFGTLVMPLEPRQVGITLTKTF
jgi:iron complex outermembrane receptor protein